MANALRLIELGMSPQLAKEVAAQIEAATSSTVTVTAANVSFDPDGVPGVSAETVQDAIDELAIIVDSLGQS